MFEVQYRCLYREFWYDTDGSTDDIRQAVKFALQVAQQRGAPARVINAYEGVVVYQTA